MTNSVPFSDTVRSFMDFFVERSMRAWKHFAREAGMSMPQFSILMQLHYRGSCSISDIGERFQTTSAAASQLIDRLVQSGYLERAEDPSDRRTRLLTLTPKGRELVEASLRERYRWIEEVSARLDEPQKQKVTEALSLMLAAVQELEPATP